MKKIKRQLAKMFGVSNQTIYYILNNKIWKYI